MARKIGLILGLSFESQEAYTRLGPVDVDQAADGRIEPGGSGLISLGLDRARVWSTFEDRGWTGVGDMALEAAERLRKMGAEGLALAGCAGHKIAPRLEKETGLPLLHIADPLGAEMERLGLTSLGLMGARFTLSDGHLRDRLKDRFGLRVLVPEPADIEVVQSIIHDQLLKGREEEGSRAEVARIAEILRGSGAQAIGLAFADLARIVGPDQTPLPILETTSLHAAFLAREAGL